VSEFPYVGLFNDGNGCHPLTYQGDNHLLTVGPPGTGKSSGLLIPNLALLSRRSMLVIDIKGELAAITAQYRQRFGRVVVLNPFGVLADRLPFMRSQGFNPLAVLNPAAPTFVDDCKALARGIVKIEGVDPHWTRSAQGFLAALIMHVRRERGTGATLGMVRELLTETRGHYLEDGRPIPTGLNATIIEMMGSELAAVRQRAGKYLNTNREIDSIISAAETQSEFLDSPPIAEDLASKTSFDFASMRREIVTVYLVLPPSQLINHARWLRLVIASAIASLSDFNAAANGGRVLFALDEFANLGHMEDVETAAGLARGFKIQMWPFVQDLSQLQQLYGNNWEIFLGGAGYQSFFAPRTMTTARHISERCGEIEVTKTSRSSNLDGAMSRSYNPAREPLYSATKLCGMAARQTIGFLEHFEEPVFCEVPHYTDKRLTWCAGLPGTMAALPPPPARSAEPKKITAAVPASGPWTGGLAAKPAPQAVGWWSQPTAAVPASGPWGMPATAIPPETYYWPDKYETLAWENPEALAKILGVSWNWGHEGVRKSNPKALVELLRACAKERFFHNI